MVDLNQTKLLGFSNIPSLAIRAEDLGTPGARLSLHIIPHIEGDDTPDDRKLIDTTPRQFRVSAKLSNSASAVDDAGWAGMGWGSPGFDEG